MKAGRFFYLDFVRFNSPLFSCNNAMSNAIPNLRSGILKSFKKDFHLDEDGIRRIEAILINEAKKLSTPSVLVYHVQREDDRFYETTDLADVLNDPNVSGKRIRVCVVLQSKTPVWSLS